MRDSERSQAPRILISDEDFYTDDTWGMLAGVLAAEYGLSPDRWQEIVLRDWFARRGNTWAHTTCGLSVPRQNGKNALLEIRELFGLIGRGERILHTAHELRTARNAFSRLLGFFGQKANDPGAKYPELNALVENVRMVNGQEAVYLKNGGSVVVAARSKGGGRGLTVDTLVLDEAQELSEESIEALIPMTSASPLADPQWLFTGTPPGPRANGEVFTRVREEALGGKGKRISWHEWSPTAETDPDSRESWAECNPALSSGRLQLSVIEGERARFSDEGFYRERLGSWSTLSAGTLIPAEVWQAAADETSLATEDVAVAVDVAPDRGTASVALAGRNAQGRWHVELEETRSGTGWLVPYLVRLVTANPQIRAVVIDAASPAAPLIDDLAKEKVKVTVTQARDMANACGAFYDGVMEGWVAHIDQPQLTFALANARKRQLGDSWAWNRRSATSDITPLVACTLALWGARASEVKRPQRRAGKAVFTGV